MFLLPFISWYWRVTSWTIFKLFIERNCFGTFNNNFHFGVNVKIFFLFLSFFHWTLFLFTFSTNMCWTLHLPSCLFTATCMSDTIVLSDQARDSIRIKGVCLIIFINLLGSVVYNNFWKDFLLIFMIVHFDDMLMVCSLIWEIPVVSPQLHKLTLQLLLLPTELFLNHLSVKLFILRIITMVLHIVNYGFYHFFTLRWLNLMGLYALLALLFLKCMRW